MEAFGALSGIVGIFIIIVAILAFLMPFFVLRIRSEMIKLNKNMEKVIELLGGKASPTKNIKVCPHCNAKNRQEDYTCLNCGKPLFIDTLEKNKWKGG